MRLEPGLKLKPRLILSPEHQQAIELLVKPVIDVALWVQEEINQNPLLEDIDAIEEPEAAETIEEEIVEEEKQAEEQKHEEQEWDRLFHDGADLGYRSSREVTGSDVNLIEHIQVSERDLTAHLLWQLRMVCPESQRVAAEFLVNSLDDRGFLSLSVEEAAQHLNLPPPEVDHVLKIIQNLDPPGIGARDLQETLLIQLDHLEEESLEFVRPIIQFYLSDLTKHNYRKIASQLKIKLEKVLEAVDIISSLNPHPARDFGGGDTKYIVPDVFIRDLEGKLEVIINENPLPRVGLNFNYLRLARSTKLTPEELAYFKEKYEKAKWIMHTVHQRNRSLYLVTRFLVDYQLDFFKQGIDFLKPLTLKDVAEQVGFSISTISRLTNRKYVDSPRGLFQLKYFFSNSIPMDDGRSLSARAVKQKIRQFIHQESRENPYSDIEIQDRLAREGIRIQRRTVAKYRELMGILPKSLRRGTGQGHAAPVAPESPPPAAEPSDASLDSVSEEEDTDGNQDDRPGYPLDSASA